MKTLAAVLVELGQPLQLLELEIPALRPGQVLVEIGISGVCHTQLLECRGHRGEDRFLPHCLGHEASGKVLDIGAGVTKVRPGQQVVASWIKGSGLNVPGTVYSWADRKVNAGAITTFSKHAVISENRLVQLPDGVSMQAGAALGCAVPTGLGAVFNTAGARPGECGAVFGCGGVGLCAVAAADIAGCNPIVAVDLEPSKLELARQMGATHTVLASEKDAAKQIAEICPGGLDFAVEATGVPEVMLQGMAAVRSQGGVAVVVGNAHHGSRLSLDPGQLNQGKQLRGTWGGDVVPDRDLPRYGALLRAGRLKLDPLFGKTYSLSQINDALDQLESRTVARPFIDPTLE